MLIKAELKREQKKPEIAWICRLAQENNNRLTEEQLADLLGLNQAYAKTLLNNLKYLGLLKPNNSLTPDGTQAAESGNTFIAEEGTYLIWFIKDHFLFKNDGYHMILHWMPWDIYRQEKEPEQSSKRIKGKVSSLIEDGVSAREWLIEAYGEEIANYQGSVGITWDWSAPSEHLGSSQYDVEQELSIDGEFSVPEGTKKRSYTVSKGFTTTISSPQTVTVKSVLALLAPALEKEGMRWDSERCAVGVWFEGLTDMERKTFTKQFQGVPAPMRGQQFVASFNNTPIVPFDTTNARAWKSWMFKQELTEHLGANDIERINGAINEASPLGSFDIDLDIDEIKNEYWRQKDHRFWYLSASDDLRIKIEETKRRAIASGEELSFSQAIARLFPDVRLSSITKVLYMDRHVLERYNIRNARRFFETLAEEGFAGIVTVITRARHYRDELSAIPNLRVMDYDELYSRPRMPHGRYFVTKGNMGTTLYELTHNLIHPSRTREGTLAWNDISAIKFTAEEMSHDPTRSVLVDFINGR